MTRETEIALIALMAAFIVVLRFIPAIALPIGVPITAQSLGIMLAGTMLGARAGFFSVLLFVGLALLGLPVLSSGVTGLAIFSAPTAGFVLGFAPAAFLTGWGAARLGKMSVFWASFLGAILGAVLFLYALGILGLMMNTGLSFVASIVAMAPYIPGDIFKAVLAGLITAQIYQIRPQYVLTRQN